MGVSDKCQGSRSELGYTGNICPYCEGTGEETVRTGHITARKTCTYCEGSRIFIKFKCLECEGTGRKMYNKPFMLDIPPGTDHGQVFRMELDPRQLGLPESDWGIKQWLWVTVSVGDSEHFFLDNRDLETDALTLARWFFPGCQVARIDRCPGRTDAQVIFVAPGKKCLGPLGLGPSLWIVGPALT